MKRLFILSLLLCTSASVLAQDIPKELLKTWMPIMTQNYKGDTLAYITSSSITFWSFNENRNGYLISPGTTVKKNFTYTIATSDSLNLNIGGLEGVYAKIAELTDDRLVMVIDSNEVNTFIPVPSFQDKTNSGAIKGMLFGKTWTFTSDHPYPLKYDIHFLPSLEDSSFVLSEYYNQTYSARLNGPLGLDRSFWGLANHGGTPILSIPMTNRTGMIDEFQALLVKNVDRTKITFAYWYKGEEFELTATKWKKKTSRVQRKDIENLTRQPWRIQEEATPLPTDTVEFIGSVGFSTYLLDEGEAYVNDSTSLISQEDIDNHSLILKFDKTGKYRIYRESRVLDEGKWSFQFNNSIIYLISEREEILTDGIFGGYIKVQKLTNNRFIVKRVFKAKLNKYFWDEESLWEVYKPVR
ncbi:hypothetical protein [Roseivirga sp.]|uniref:hypothetical protein n=1 Tax=Roseivirga sp. TaxID=1964215 RepID=UPI002B26A32B|nr:hypothetical protein [Roseivirga sp.]